MRDSIRKKIYKMRKGIMNSVAKRKKCIFPYGEILSLFEQKTSTKRLSLNEIKHFCMIISVKHGK